MKNNPSFGKLKVMLFAVLAILVLGIISYIVIARLVNKPDTAKITPPETLSIFYTCDTRGHIEPCGCASGMAGGLSRRQTLLNSRQSKDSLLVDVGDVAAGGREWEILEFEYILRAYRQIGYHAVNAGHREVSLGVEKLRKVSTDYDFFVSANLLDAQGRRLFEPYRIVTLSGGYRCGIIGVMDEQLAPDEVGPGLTILSPNLVLSRLLPELKEKTDFILLMAFAPEEKMKELAGQFYEIDVIIGGKVPQSSGTALRENRSIIVYITDKGKSVGQLNLAQHENQWRPENNFHLLKESMERAPQIVTLVEEYKQALMMRDFRPHKDDEEGLSSITVRRSETSNTFVGPQACESCHPKAYQIWLQSKHARAFHTLELKDHHYNPRCLKCHTVSYMTSDGYINQKLTPKLKNVSCEACHGRCDYHVKQKSEQKIPVKRVFMKKPKCTNCHDKENSPNYDSNAYWSKIEHDKS